MLKTEGSEWTEGTDVEGHDCDCGGIEEAKLCGFLKLQWHLNQLYRQKEDDEAKVGVCVYISNDNHETID